MVTSTRATDKATSKEQHITIAGRSGLSQEEIERAVRDAEEHAEEDRQRREAVEARNAADSAVYGAEKLVSDQGEKISEDLKTEINEAIQTVKDLLAQESPPSADLTAAVDGLQRSLQKVGEAVYAQQGGDGGAAPPPGDEDGDEKPGDDGDTVEGEFREV